MPSIREEVADALADTCIFGGLNESYGVIKSKETSNGQRTYWSVTFAKARTLDGHIRVYSPTFIWVGWEGALAKARGLEFRGNKVFKSEHEAKSFIIGNFVKV